MRSLVFPCATTVAPLARSGALLSVWSKCQCVWMTTFTGAPPSPLSDSWNLGHAGATNVSTTTIPSEPWSTTTLPPGPASRVRFSPSGCACIGMAPIRARAAATGSCGGFAARASSRGKSPSTSAPAPIAAIIRNHSRRVLPVTVRLMRHLPSRVAVQYVPGAVLSVTVRKASGLSAAQLPSKEWQHRLRDRTGVVRERPVAALLEDDDLCTWEHLALALGVADRDVGVVLAPHDQRGPGERSQRSRHLLHPPRIAGRPIQFEDRASVSPVVVVEHLVDELSR